ncbi:MAG: recombination protein NinG, partial [Gammaproteobacteria bacterium]
CISSGKPLDWSGNAVDAGHYRSVGSAPHLRFDERNCHAQSKQDNRFLSGNAVDYRIGLIARIGQEAVDALEADQSVRKYTVEQIKGIKAYYRAKTRKLKRAAA